MIDKTIKGINYRLDEENLTAEVIQEEGYEGDIIIPETVVFNKVAYRVTSIEEEAFLDCSSLTSITYNGTKEQWQQIALAPEWNEDIPAKVVHCSDGDVELGTANKTNNIN